VFKILRIDKDKKKKKILLPSKEKTEKQLKILKILICPLEDMFFGEEILI
jgi:hypothetical protein